MFLNKQLFLKNPILLLLLLFIFVEHKQTF